MDREKLRAKLEDMRAQLEREGETGKGDRAPVELDQTSVGRLSRMGAIQVQAMALASEQRRRVELRRVLGALERIGTDDFGYCDICGDEIAPARLENDPAARTCITCAS
jgi:DnaK suppressor protein